MSFNKRDVSLAVVYKLAKSGKKWYALTEKSKRSLQWRDLNKYEGAIFFNDTKVTLKTSVI